MNIRAFIDACLAEDERLARDAEMSPERVTGIPRSYAAAPIALHIARHDPGRDLRQVAATRAVLRWHDEQGCAVCVDDPDGCDLYRAIASIWPDAPGYRDYWGKP